jgi:asparagine synthase (glutamine-hydrolysing)
MRALVGAAALAPGPHPAAVIAELQAGFAGAAVGDTLKLVSTSDLRSRVPEKLLMRVDKMSMAHSLEARAPFLDRRLVDLVLPIPGDMLARSAPGARPETKGLLRAVAGPYLPETIIRRPKMGFQPPIAEWLRRSLGDAFAAQVETGPIFAEGILQREPCRRLLAAHRAGAEMQVKLWNLLSLALWYQRFGVNGIA